MLFSAIPAVLVQDTKWGSTALGTRPRQLRRLWLFGTSLILASVLLMRFAGAVDAQSVTLAWDPISAPGIAGYNVYRSESFGLFTSGPLNKESLVTATSFTDSTVQNSRTTTTL